LKNIFEIYRKIPLIIPILRSITVLLKKLL